MIRNRTIVRLGVSLFLLLFFNGCTFTRESPNPVKESIKEDVATQEAIEKKKEPVVGKAVLPTPEMGEQDSLKKHRIVTEDQIEKRLFPEKAVRIQRPIKGLNSYQEKAGENKGSFIFNFDEADLSEVVRTFAEVLEIDYYLEAGASGTVTVHTTGGLHKSQIFPVFMQILEANGLAAVREGGIYRIVPDSTVSKSYLNVNTASDLSGVSPAERMIIQIVSLEHMDVSEMVKIIEPFLSEKGSIIVHDGTNTMVLVDKGIAVMKALDLVQVFDVDTFSQKNHHLYSVINMEAEEAAKLIIDLLKAYSKSETKNTVIPIKRLNSVIVVSQEPATFKWVSDILKQVDTPGYDTSPKIYIYKVQNGDCQDLSSLLTTIFRKTESDKKEKITEAKETASDRKIVTLGSVKAEGLSGSAEAEPAPVEQSKTLQVKPVTSADTGSDTLKGDIRISPDIDRNALIIEAYPSDYQIVRQILEQLDIMPRQVLIEVMIADISLTDKSDLGIEWTKFLDGGSVGKKNFSGSIGETGMSFTVGLSDDWQAALSALASEDRVNILSTPIVLASDNKEATIDVADEIPVVTTEYKTVSDSDDVVETNVQYRKTGIILKVTPHINDQGFVTMEISQEVSNVGDGVTAGGKEYPSFKTRNINTTFTVSHQQTIMIGGLMRQEGSEGEKGMPVLSSLPGIGWLFGRQTESMIKTELTVFITPHVIYSMGDVEQIATEFRQRVPMKK